MPGLPDLRVPTPKGWSGVSAAGRLASSALRCERRKPYEGPRFSRRGTVPTTSRPMNDRAGPPVPALDEWFLLDAFLGRTAPVTSSVSPVLTIAPIGHARKWPADVRLPDGMEGPRRRWVARLPIRQRAGQARGASPSGGRPKNDRPDLPASTAR